MTDTGVAGRSWVVAADGVRLAVRTSGPPQAPTVLAVHGYPDDHSLWTEVAARLGERYRVAVYDMRGTGDSPAPPDPDAYRLGLLADDLGRVAEAVSPHAPVHLLAHDWGAITAWQAVSDQRLNGKFASLTSISGPCLDHAGHWLRSRVRRPSPRGLSELGRQLLSSAYLWFFCLPVLPELSWRSGVLPWLLSRMGGEGVEIPSTPDAIRGLALYRVNIPSRLRAPVPRRVFLPVQVIAPTEDRFVTPALQTGVERWVPDLRVHRVPGGHWLPRSRPDVVADRTARFIEEIGDR